MTYTTFTPEQMGSWAGIPIYRHQLLELKIRYGVRIATLPTIASTPYLQWVGKDLEQLDFSLRLYNLTDIRTWQAQQNQISDPVKVLILGNFGGSDWVLTDFKMRQDSVNYMTGTDSAASLQYQADISISAIRESF